jgi:hypothetical protein
VSGDKEQRKEPTAEDLELTGDQADQVKGGMLPGGEGGGGGTASRHLASKKKKHSRRHQHKRTIGGV